MPSIGNKVLSSNMQIILVLENIRSLHNIGALWRSSDWAGSPQIILIGYTATPPRREITKTALWAEACVPWEYFLHIEDFFENKQWECSEILALEEWYGGQDIYEYQPKDSTKTLYLIVGNEVEWVSEYARTKSDGLIYLPTHGQKNSLNVSIAGSIALFHLRHIDR